MDMGKAFDKVSHSDLIYKLRSFEIQRSSLHILENFGITGTNMFYLMGKFLTGY